MASENIRIVLSETGSERTARGIRKVGEEGRRAGGSINFLRTALAAVGVGALIREYVRLSSQFQVMSNRIRLVTSDARQHAAVMRHVNSIANETFTGLRETGELFARVALNTRELSLTQEQLGTVVRGVNQAVLVSGAGVREASNAIIQLSQGLALGALRGRELRSVMEQLPFVADIISKEMGVMRGELIRLGRDGKITAEVVTNAFINQRDDIQAAFEEFTPSIQFALVVLRNSVLAFVGSMDNATGAARFLVRVLLLLARNMNLVLTAVISLAVVMGVTFATRTIAGIVVPSVVLLTRTLLGLRAAITAVTVAMLKNPLTFVFVAVLGTILFLLEKITGLFSRIAGVWDRFVGGVVGDGGSLQDTVRSFTEGMAATADVALDSTLERLDQEKELARLAGQRGLAVEVERRMIQIRNQALQNQTRFTSEQEKEIRAAIQINEQLTRRGQLLASLREKSEGMQEELDLLALPEGLRAEQEIINQFVRAIREAGAASAELGAELDKILSIRSRLVDRRADQSFRDAQSAINEQIWLLQTANEEREAEQRILQLTNQAARDGVDVSEEWVSSLRKGFATLRGSRAQDDIESATRSMKEQVAIMRLRSEGLESEARLMEILNRHSVDRKNITSEALEALEDVTAQLQEQEARERILRDIQGDRLRIEQDIAAARLLAAEAEITESQASRRINQLRIEQLQGDPTVAAGFERGVRQVFDQITDLAALTEQTIVGAFNTMENELVSFVQTGEFNFSRLVDSILADLTRLLARQALLALVGAMTGTATPVAAASVAQSFGGARAGGGPVSPGRSFLVGEEGPELFTPRTPGTIVPNDAMGGSPEMNVTVVNVMSEDMVGQALNDPRNQEIIVNTIGKHRSAVNRQLGRG